MKRESKIFAKFSRMFHGMTWRVLLALLPLACYVVLWVYCARSTEFVNITKNEDERVEIKYKQIAYEMLDAPHAQKKKWLRATRPSKDGAWRKNDRIRHHYWGTAPSEDGAMYVWVMAEPQTSKSEDVYIQKVGEEAKTNFQRDLTVVGGCVFLAMAGVSFFAIFAFYVYAKSRDDFMKAAIHDLTTPLVALRLHVSGHGENDEAKIITERLLRLVDNMNAFMWQGARKKPEIKAVNLRALYDEAYQLFREDFRDYLNGRDIEVIARGEAFQVLADETYAIQILWNLLGNALKYGAPKGPVKVIFTAREKWIDCAIADEGDGLTRPQMRKIFNRYYRARSIASCGKGGFGIGLCVSREFAKQMGGSLSVAANTPKGCIFTLTLPKASAAE